MKKITAIILLQFLVVNIALAHITGPIESDSPAPWYKNFFLVGGVIGLAAGVSAVTLLKRKKTPIGS